MITLENEYLKILISPEGAEMHSVYNKISHLEHIWQAEASIWSWHAPNLFPVVGGCINNQLQVEGKTYPINRHGFARNSTFNVLQQSLTEAEFSLGHNKETLQSYPYQFLFQVLYQLEEHQLKVIYKVINEDNRDIYFSVGAHPAFNIPFHPSESYEDYYLEFESEEALETHLLSAEGYFTGEKETVDTAGRILPLNKKMFDKDALVFKSLRSKKLWLRSKIRSQHISVNFPYFDYLGLWAKPGANFLCIEPWIGCADSEGEPVEISGKEGMRKLEKGHVFEADITIGFHQS